MLAACALASSYACIRSSLLSVLVAAGLVCHKNECERNLAAFAQFLTDPREATLIGLAILKQGGLAPGAPPSSARAPAPGACSPVTSGAAASSPRVPRW